jgi:hypothetical protein
MSSAPSRDTRANKAASKSKKSGNEHSARKIRFEAWLTAENYDFLFQLANSDGRNMSNMFNEILRRMRVRPS